MCDKRGTRQNLRAATVAVAAATTAANKYCLSNDFYVSYLRLLLVDFSLSGFVVNFEGVFRSAQQR